MIRRIDNRPSRSRRAVLPAAALAVLALAGCSSDGSNVEASAPSTSATAPATPASSEAPKQVTNFDPTSAEAQKLTTQLSEFAKNISTNITTASSSPSQGLECIGNSSDGSLHATNRDSLGGSTAALYDFDFVPNSDTSGTIGIEVTSNTDLHFGSEIMPAGSNVGLSFSVQDGADIKTFTELRGFGLINDGDNFTFSNAFSDANKANMTLTNITFGNGEGSVSFSSDDSGLHYSNMNFVDANYSFPTSDLTESNAEQTATLFTQLTQEFTGATLGN